MPTLQSPYSPEPSRWLRGNLHSHTTNSDGSRSPQAVVDDYAAQGYDFLVLSDHDFLTDTCGLSSRGMVLIAGLEVSAEGPHVLQIGASTMVGPDSDRQIVVSAIRADGALAIACHPNRNLYNDHWQQHDLELLDGYTGIEIYNGTTRRAEGEPTATNRWDMLLSRGKFVWGFANDDSHHEGDTALAWNMVQVASQQDITAQTILDALQAGQFYASTGVIIDSIRAEGNYLNVHAANAKRINLIADRGQRITQVESSALHFRVPDDS
ncbi:MAG: CehA/McbA family metallohydrolase, partial [Deinococcota bacterium]